MLGWGGGRWTVSQKHTLIHIFNYFLLWLFTASYCFTKTIVLLLRVVVALGCAGIVCGMFSCLLDLCGTMNRCLKVVKDYSIGNVLTGKFLQKYLATNH